MEQSNRTSDRPKRLVPLFLFRELVLACVTFEGSLRSFFLLRPDRDPFLEWVTAIRAGSHKSDQMVGVPTGDDTLGFPFQSLAPPIPLTFLGLGVFTCKPYFVVSAFDGKTRGFRS